MSGQGNQPQPPSAFNILNTSFLNCAPEELVGYLPFPTIRDSDDYYVLDSALVSAGQDVVNMVASSSSSDTAAERAQLVSDLADLLNSVALPNIPDELRTALAAVDIAQEQFEPPLLRHLRPRLNVNTATVNDNCFTLPHANSSSRLSSATTSPQKLLTNLTADAAGNSFLSATSSSVSHSSFISKQNHQPFHHQQQQHNDAKFGLPNGVAEIKTSREQQYNSTDGADLPGAFRLPKLSTPSTTALPAGAATPVKPLSDAVNSGKNIDNQQTHQPSDFAALDNRPSSVASTLSSRHEKDFRNSVPPPPTPRTPATPLASAGGGKPTAHQAWESQHPLKRRLDDVADNDAEIAASPASAAAAARDAEEEEDDADEAETIDARDSSIPAAADDEDTTDNAQLDGSCTIISGDSSHPAIKIKIKPIPTTPTKTAASASHQFFKTPKPSPLKPGPAGAGADGGGEPPAKRKRQPTFNFRLTSRLTRQDEPEEATKRRFADNVAKIINAVPAECYADQRILQVDEDDQEVEVPYEALVARPLLIDCYEESSKMRGTKLLTSAAPQALVKLLHALTLNIHYAFRIPLEELNGMTTDALCDRMDRGITAASAALCIMVTPDMPKEVFHEDCLEACVRFLRYHFENSLFSTYSEGGRTKLNTPTKKRGRPSATAAGTAVGAIVPGPTRRLNARLYQKFSEFLCLLADMVLVQKLPDKLIVELWNTALKPFYAENVAEIQPRCLQLLVNIFSRYDTHQTQIIQELISNVNRITYIRRDQRHYVLSNGDTVQIISALMLYMTQSLIYVNDSMLQEKARGEKEIHELENVLQVKYDWAACHITYLLDLLVTRVTSKSDDNLRQFFDNIIDDFMACIMHPDVPIAATFVLLLKQILLQRIVAKETDQTTKLYCLDFMAALGSRMMRSERMLRDSQEEAGKIFLDQFREQLATSKELGPGKRPDVRRHSDQLVFRQIIVEYLRCVNTGEPNNFINWSVFAHLAQWLNEQKASSAASKAAAAGGGGRNAGQSGGATTNNLYGGGTQVDDNFDAEFNELNDDIDGMVDGEAGAASDDANKQERKVVQKAYDTMLKHLARDSKAGVAHNCLRVSADDAETALKGMLLRSGYFQKFDAYLTKLIILSTRETGNQLKARYMKCLNNIVEADEKLLGRKTIKKIVENRLYDPSISVRESAVDLVGKCILTRPELLDEYYALLSLRLLDTGVSVRKRVIKIFKDVCLYNPDHKKVVDMCSRLMRRVEDEDSVKKLVHEFFQQVWLTPVDLTNDADEADETIQRRIQQFVDVAFEFHTSSQGPQILLTFLKHLRRSEESMSGGAQQGSGTNESLKQMVDALVAKLIRIDQEIVAQGLRGCNETLAKHAFAMGVLADCQPHLFVKHVRTILPYISQGITGQYDNMVVEGMARVLARAVPVMDNPMPSLLSELEEAVSGVIIRKGVNSNAIEAACLCFAEVSQRVTGNWKMLHDAYKKFYGILVRMKKTREQEIEREKSKISNHHGSSSSSNNVILPSSLSRSSSFQSGIGGMRNSSSNANAAAAAAASNAEGRDNHQLQRVLCTIGYMTKYFDLSNKQLDFDADTVQRSILDACLFFYRNGGVVDVQKRALFCLGNTCLQFGSLVSSRGVKELYEEILSNSTSSANISKDNKLQVLHNLLMVLWHADERAKALEEQEQEKRKRQQLQQQQAAQSELLANSLVQTQEDEFGKVATSAVQVYLKLIIGAGMDRDIDIRSTVMKIVHCTIRQRLLHPQQVIPYLCAACADPDENLRSSAEQLLQEIDRKYTGHLQTKSLEGFRLAFDYTRALGDATRTVRGFRFIDGQCQAMLTQVYALLRTNRHQRRSIITSLINLIEEQQSTDLAHQLFLADNIALFSYQLFDEPLYLIHYIDSILPAASHSSMDAWNRAFNLDSYAVNEKKKQKLSKTDAAAAPMSLKIEEKPLTDVAVVAENGEKPVDVDEKSEKVVEKTDAGADDDDDDDDEDVDEDDVNVLMQRCQTDTETLYKIYRSFMPVLLLARLREHLQQVFRIPNDKLAQYNPADNSKTVERPLTYRKTNVPLKIDALTELLQQERQGIMPPLSSGEAENDSAQRELIVRKYLDAKHVVLLLDQTLKELQEQTAWTATTSSTSTAAIISSADAASSSNSTTQPISRHHSAGTTTTASTTARHTQPSSTAVSRHASERSVVRPTTAAAAATTTQSFNHINRLDHNNDDDVIHEQTKPKISSSHRLPLGSSDTLSSKPSPAASSIEQLLSSSSSSSNPPLPKLHIRVPRAPAVSSSSSSSPPADDNNNLKPNHHIAGLRNDKVSYVSGGFFGGAKDVVDAVAINSHAKKVNSNNNNNNNNNNTGIINNNNGNTSSSTSSTSSGGSTSSSAGGVGGGDGGGVNNNGFKMTIRTGKNVVLVNPTTASSGSKHNSNT